MPRQLFMRRCQESSVGNTLGLIFQAMTIIEVAWPPTTGRGEREVSWCKSGQVKPAIDNGHFGRKDHCSSESGMCLRLHLE